MPAPSTIRITVRSAARGRCRTPFGTQNPCALRELDRSILEIHGERAFDDEEELVLVVVLVPDVLTLDDTEAHDTVVDPTQRLVVPGVRRRIDDRLDVDQLEWRKADVEMGVELILGIHDATSLLVAVAAASPFGATVSMTKASTSASSRQEL